MSQGHLRSIVSGTAILSSVSMLRLAMQFLSVPILARLLTPEDYGIASIAMPIVLFAMMIADAGISSSLVRLNEINTNIWHTSFWMLTVGSIVIAFVMMAVAPLFAGLFAEPQLDPIIATLASIIVLQSITLVPNSALQHQKFFSRMASAELMAIVLSLGTAFYLATAGQGVWALIWQQVSYYGVKATSTLILSPYRPALRFAPSEAKEHIAFGWNLLCANLVSFISRSADSLVIGRVLGAAQLGIYAMAFQFARLPYMVVTGPLQGVLYPHLATWKDDHKRFASLFLLSTRVLALLIFPPVALVAAANRPFFTLLLSDKWASVGPIFALLAVATAVQSVRGIAVTFLMALGRTDVQKVLSFQFAIIWVAGILLTVRYGIVSVAACYTFCAVTFSFWSLKAVLPLIGCMISAYVRAYVIPVAASVGAVIVYKIVEFNSTLGDFEMVMIAGVLALLAIAVAYLTQRAEISASLRRLAGQASDWEIT